LHTFLLIDLSSVGEFSAPNDQPVIGRLLMIVVQSYKTPSSTRNGSRTDIS